MALDLAAPPPPLTLEAFKTFYPFSFDAFQREAISAYLEGRSVLVAAPTGSGKTLVAEFAVLEAVRRGLRAIYTTPIKALSNQKYRDFGALLRRGLGAGNGDDAGTQGRRDAATSSAGFVAASLRPCVPASHRAPTVGLLTGDVTENPRGQVVVMTTEVLRNMLLESPHELDDVGCVVFDEVHYLADPERGTTWEESILHCPRHVQLVCLSATVSNAEELAAWISRVHRDTELITHDRRAVPLEQHYFVDGRLHLLVGADGGRRKLLPVGGELRRPRPSGVPSTSQPREASAPAEVVRKLDARGMLPAIYFLFGRRATEEAAEQCLGLQLRRSPAMRRLRRERIAAYLAELPAEDRGLAQVQRLCSLLERGVAFHHAGLLPVLKQLVEELFAAGAIGVVFATETLALGINMPARTVVIGELAKFDGESRRLLLPNEYQQLVGRAGRRGLDDLGYAVALYSPWASCGETLELATGDLHPVRSAFTARYNTVAALHDGTAAGRERLVRLFSSTLRQFQRHDELRRAAEEVAALRRELEQTDFVCPVPGLDPNTLGEFFSRRQAQSRAEQALRRAREETEGLERQLARPPWNAPRPDHVRRAVRGFRGGEVVYVSAAASGWGVFLQRPPGAAGPGLALLGHQVVQLDEWQHVAYLPEPQPALALPPALAALDCPAADVRPLLSPEAWGALRDQLESLRLPDLAAEEARQRRRTAQALAPALAVTGERVAAAQEALGAEQAAVAALPCGTCTVRAEHERTWRRRRAALQSLAAAEGHAEELERAVASEARRLLDSIEVMLERFGFLRSRPGATQTAGRNGSRRRLRLADGRAQGALALAQPTAKATVLSRVYDSNGFFLVEIVWRGALDRLSPPELLELLSWFCHDRQAPRYNRFHLPERLWELRPELWQLQAEIQEAEAAAGVALTTGFDPRFYGPVLAWVRGAPFADLLERIALGEGDLIQVINKTLDLAAQIREALRTGAGHDRRLLELADRLEEGDRVARRGLVAQCLRLPTVAI